MNPGRVPVPAGKGPVRECTTPASARRTVDRAAAQRQNRQVDPTVDRAAHTVVGPAVLAVVRCDRTPVRVLAVLPGFLALGTTVEVLGGR